MVDGPNPGLALRHIFDGMKALDPTLTDAAIAAQLGVSPTAIVGWCKGKIPRQRHRMAIRRLIGGVVDAIPQAYAEAEVREVEATVKPFALPPVAS